MKNYAAFLFAFLLSTAAMGQYRFSKLFDYNIGQNNLQGSHALLQTNDGGYLIAGKNTGAEFSDNKILLTRTDAQGNLMGVSVIYREGFIFYLSWRTMLPLSDGDLLLAGTIKNLSNDFYQAFLMKIDTVGNIIWEKEYGSSTSLNDVRLSQDGHIFFCGHSKQIESSGNIYVVKTTLEGVQVWAKDFGEQGWQNAYQCDLTPDGGIALAIMEGTATFTDYAVIKLDSLGTFQWKTPTGGDFDDGVYPKIRSHTDGALFFAGGKGRNNAEYDAYLAKLSASGQKIWEQTYPAEFSSSLFTAPIILEDGSIVSSGSYHTGDFGNQIHSRMLKLTPDGELIWQRIYAHAPQLHNYGYDMIRTSDGGFAMTGLSFNTTDQDTWLLKVDSFGCLEPGCQSVPTAEPNAADVTPVRIWPNPADAFVQIESPEAALLGLHLSDLQGRVLEDIQFRRADQVKEYRLLLSNCPSGFYFLVLRTEKGWVTRKIVRG